MKKIFFAIVMIGSIHFLDASALQIAVSETQFDEIMNDYLSKNPTIYVIEQLATKPNQTFDYTLYENGFYYICRKKEKKIFKDPNITGIKVIQDLTPRGFGVSIAMK